MTAKFTEASPDGILLIDKEEGKTSFDAVRTIRRLLKCKKTGHAGTLDPFATGLLVILLGKGTKLSPYIMGGEKKYRAEIKLGVETDTCDPTGSVIKEMPVPGLTDERIAETLEHFTGIIEQVPPAYSAVRVNGQRAYKLARKGIDVELKKREVKVYSINVIEIRLPLIIIEVSCSAGTYIRSLASDIGRRLETGAHLNKLRRLSSGSFNVDDALALKDLDPVAGDTLLSRIIPLNKSLEDMKAVNLDHYLAERVRNGYRPSWNELNEKAELPDMYDGYVRLMTDSDLIAIMEIDRLHVNENKWLKKVKVFH